MSIALHILVGWSILSILVCGGWLVLASLWTPEK